MKRLILVLVLLSQPVWAKTIPVQALEDFSTENPPTEYSVKVLDELVLDEKVTLNEGDIVQGKIVDVKNAKRLKRNAGFSFVPETVRTTAGNTVSIAGYYPAKYTTQLNKGEMAKTAALSVGNHFVKGISLGYRTVEGVVKNEQGNRFKSGADALYENTPLSYVEKGQEIFIPKNQNFLLNFKTKNPKDIPNYEYEELTE